MRLNAGSTDADQLTNAHVNSSFVATGTLTNFVKKMPTATFDDLVVYKSPMWTINTIPKSVPQITTVTPPNNGCYSTGQALTFTLTYGAAVTVTGTPQLDLTIGAHTRYATYVSGSGSTALVFSYTVQASDSAVGISAAANVDANGGAVMSGTAYSVTGFTAPDLSQVRVNCPVYVVDQGNNRVEKFDTQGNFVLAFGTAGTGNGQFDLPTSVAVDASGNVWVGDYWNLRVEKFDSNGNYLLQFATINHPTGIAFDPSGNVWVTNQYANVVEKFSSSGVYQSQFGTLGSGNGQFSTNLEGIAIDDSGNIWVVDTNNYRVQKFDSTGSYLLQIVPAATPYPTHFTPVFVAVDASGNLFALDDYDVVLLKFNSSGTYQSSVGGWGYGAGYFRQPGGVAVDSSGNIWVTSVNNNIEVYNSSGVYQFQFGSAGNGQFNSSYGPYGIAIVSR